MRRTRVFTALLGAVALIAAGCVWGDDKRDNTTTGANGNAKVKTGGTLRIGSAAPIDSLNPFVAQAQDSANAFMQIYPFLLHYDAQLKPVSDFASSWSVSPDGKTYTFKTKSGGKWTDGQPITAKDAEYTIQTIIKYADGPTGMVAGFTAGIESVQATDPNTLVVTYGAPTGNALSQLAGIPILPQHIWSKEEGENGNGLRAFKNGPPTVSGGPFQLTTFRPKEIALFERNPGFYGKRPNIDGFGLQTFANPDALVVAMTQGELDMAENVPPTSLETLGGATGIEVVTTPGVLTEALYINARENRVGHKELLKPEVRQALSMAINRDEIVKIGSLGAAHTGGSLVPPATGDWYDSSVQPPAFDIAAANAKLDELGYTKGSNGIRQADGEPMSYDVLVLKDAGLDRPYQTIADGFEQIGVELNEKLVDTNGLFGAVAANKFLTWTMALVGSTPLVDPNYVLSNYTCDGLAEKGGGNVGGYCNPEYDELFKQQAAATDAGERQDLVHQAQALLAKDTPTIVLAYRDVAEAHSKKWSGFVLSPQGSFNQLSKLTLQGVHQSG